MEEFFSLLESFVIILCLAQLSYGAYLWVRDRRMYIADVKKNGTPLLNALYDILGAVLSCNPTNQSAKEDLMKAFVKNEFRYRVLDGFYAASVWKHLNDGSNLEKQASYLVTSLKHSERRSFTQLLFKLATQDDGIKNDEWQRLLYILSLMKLNQFARDYLISRYEGLRTESDDYSSQQQSSGSSSSSSSSSCSSSSTALSADYVLLGLPASASQHDVQAAYHSLALKYHPDLPKNAGNQQFCIDQMAKINAAYDRIMANFA